MNRCDALPTMFATAGAVAIQGAKPLFGQQPEMTASSAEKVPSTFETAPVKIDPVAPHLFMISGPGGNIGLFEGNDRLIMVDGGIASRANETLAAVNSISSKTVDLLINTHWHFDHTGCNEILGKKGTRITAQENTHRRLSQVNHMDFFGIDFQPLPPEGLPVVTFDDVLTEYPEGIKLTHVPPAHTDGDAFVFFPEQNVLHTGDLFFSGLYPIIDSSSGGSVDGMISAKDRILSVVNNETIIIPGHGPLSRRADLINARDMLITVRDKIRPLFKAGKTLPQILKTKPTAEFDSEWGEFLTGDQFVKVVYLSMQRSDGH